MHVEHGNKACRCAIAVAIVYWLITADSDVERGGIVPNADITTFADAEFADESRTADWLAYGRTHSEQRFSPP